MSSAPKRTIPARIGNYALGRLLGSGYSGSIYEAVNIYNRHIVALKLQDVDHECPTNTYERHLYPHLQGGKGMPTLWAAGVQDGWDYLVIDLLGASLEKLYKSVGGPAATLDIGAVLSIAMQMISRLETMHARGVLHRDIQLGNMVIGRGPNASTLYMIDFGFSKCYIDPRTRRHIPDSKAKRDFIGNYWFRFASLSKHTPPSILIIRGGLQLSGRTLSWESHTYLIKVPSRRDDLEAAALMFIHLLTPRGLAWTRNGIPLTDADHDILKQHKRSVRPDELCHGLPGEFEEFLRYTRSLKFAEKPDYQRWTEEFRELKIELGYGGSDEFIWPPPQPQPSALPAYRRIRSPDVAPAAIEGILNDLTRLQLNNPGARQVLADHTNVAEAAHRARDNVSKEVIEISSGSEEGESKATRLLKLTSKACNATDNAELGELVRQFIQALKCNSSRTLTREASTFLDALQKQLKDPSVFVAPTRTSRQWSDISQAEDKEPPHIKLGVVARLKSQVAGARSNKDMATMVAEFCKVTNKSTGRTITKDGFGFLDGLANRLIVLQ